MKGLKKMLISNLQKNQFIIQEETKTSFQSYKSLIATIDFGDKIISIFPDYNYSTTTGKYRNMFFKQVGFSCLANLQDLEKAIKKGFCESDGKIKYKIIKE